MNHRYNGPSGFIQKKLSEIFQYALALFPVPLLIKALASRLDSTVDFPKLAEALLNLDDDHLAYLISRVIGTFFSDGSTTMTVAHKTRYKRYFELWESQGFHITPTHFYSPIPDTREIPDHLWEEQSALHGIRLNQSDQINFLQDVIPLYKDEYLQFSHEPTGVPYQFHYKMPGYGHADAPILHCMIRYHKPKLVIEVGSGTSTLITAQASRINNDTELLCIEPYPTELLKKGFPGSGVLIQKKVQDIDTSVFKRLEENDILFIDSSHILKCGSDVTYLYLEVLPNLNPGVIVHIHDIFLPEKEYPRAWVLDHKLFWNEQHLLQAFLIHNTAFEVLFAGRYMTLNHPDAMKSCFPEPWWISCSFWMRKNC